MRQLAFVASALLAISLVLTGCSSKSSDPFAGVGSPRYPGNGPLPKGGGRYHVGKPYQVAGRWFHPTEQPDYDKVGIASWYGPQFHRRRTSNGEWFDMNYLSAAHPTLPLPSYVKVTNLENGREIIVRVNDRGPFVGTRIIDLSRRPRKSSTSSAGGWPRSGCSISARHRSTTRASISLAMNRELERGTSTGRMIAAAAEAQSAAAGRRSARARCRRSCRRAERRKHLGLFRAGRLVRQSRQCRTRPPRNGGDRPRRSDAAFGLIGHALSRARRAAQR